MRNYVRKGKLIVCYYPPHFVHVSRSVARSFIQRVMGLEEAIRVLKRHGWTFRSAPKSEGGE